MFDFTDDLSVGNEAIDADHRAFFEMARLIHESVHGGKHDLIILSALLMLDEYVDGHFYREEKAMKAVGYPRLAGHRHRHRVFRGRVRAIVEAYREGTMSVADNLSTLVVQWLRSHITNDDLQYKTWITHSSVDSRPLVYLAMEAEELSHRQHGCLTASHIK